MIGLLKSITSHLLTNSLPASKQIKLIYKHTKSLDLSVLHNLCYISKYT